MLASIIVWSLLIFTVGYLVLGVLDKIASTRKYSKSRLARLLCRTGVHYWVGTLDLTRGEILETCIRCNKDRYEYWN